ncbi:MAG: glycogen debranching protein GlgX [Chloroflexi bacterium]|nr:glycogen debranching protein GlgX [Chloroflexota bacterium]
MPYEIQMGVGLPQGATWDSGLNGTNFSLFARNATRVELCLFEGPAGKQEQRLELPEPVEHVWQGFVPGVRPGQLYGYRVHGAYAPESGNRFNPAKLLIDPYARAIAGGVDWQQPVFGYRLGGVAQDLDRDDGDSAAGVPKSIVVDPTFDWAGDEPPRISWNDTIIYEAHVKGLTARHPDVPECQRGTYAGLASPPIIDHLKRLGVTALELLPIHHFLNHSYLLDKGLTNYWGYNTIGYFAPESRYSAAGDQGQQVVEFKHMVKRLHAAGFEVILDVVYNHTAEGNHLGPTLCFRGVDNRVYYNLVADDPRHYMDFTGTGNTLNVGHSQTLKLIADSLRLWVEEYHIDGFRFDLAITLARDPVVGYDKGASFFDIIYQDPVLSRVKLIGEPWDVGDYGYQVGNFPPNWSEWNGKYRDTVRRFWKGDDGQLPDLADALTGSPKLYRTSGRGPRASVNFVTAHDGFTLRDLVSYNDKHNAANGEENNDGATDNQSWNCGVEGETDDATINSLRSQQQRNFLATLMFAQGVPMLLHGDELGRTQGGNNNAYCQDNEITWVDWELDDCARALLAFTRAAIEVRKDSPLLHRAMYATGEVRDAVGLEELAWFQADGKRVSETTWADDNARSIGMRLASPDECLLLLVSAYWEDLDFVLPPARADGGGQWQCVLDTSGDSTPGGASGTTFTLRSRSLVLLRDKPS